MYIESIKLCNVTATKYTSQTVSILHLLEHEKTGSKRTC